MAKSRVEHLLDLVQSLAPDNAPEQYMLLMHALCHFMGSLRSDATSQQSAAMMVMRHMLQYPLWGKPHINTDEPVTQAIH